MHKVEFAPEDIQLALKRRGRVQVYETIEPTKTALLVVDMQTAFLAPGSPAEIPVAREIVPNINRIARALRQAGGMVAWIVSTYGPGAENDWTVVFRDIHGPERSDAFRMALADGAPGHALWPEFDRQPDDPVVSKARFSPFAHPARALELMLRERGIDMVLITGTVTGICCESTARDAVMRNFKTIMVSDANADRSDREHNAALTTFMQAFGGVMGTDDILRLIAGQRFQG